MQFSIIMITFHNMEITVPVRSLKKALEILDFIIEAGMRDVDVSLSGLAHHMQMPANTVHNLLKTMVACGYVQKTGHGLYVQGLKCRQLGLLNRLATPTVHAEALERMRDFAAQMGESCLLAVLLNGTRTVVARVDGTQAIQVSHATIEERPFFSVATGRLLAAYASDEELHQIIARHGMPGSHWDGITTPAALTKALEAIRKQGFCQTNTPKDTLIGLASPIFKSEDRIWGVLGLYAPSFRCPPKRRIQLRNAMKTFAVTLKDVSSNQ